MEIKCIECGQIYTIDDEQIAGKYFAFNCEKCQHEIIVDQRATQNFSSEKKELKENRKAEKQITKENKKTEKKEQKESFCVKRKISTKLLHAKDLLHAVKDSFNLKGFSFALVFYLILAILTIIGCLIFYRTGGVANTSFIVYTSICAVVLCYLYSFLSFLISKNYYYRLKDQQNSFAEYLDFSLAKDSLNIFVWGTALILLLGLLALPLALLKKGAFLYGGIIFPLVYFLTFALLLSLFLNFIIPALIAKEPLSLKNNFYLLGRIITDENINLPFYYFFSRAICLMFDLFASLFFLGSSFLVSLLILASASGESKTDLAQSFLGDFSLANSEFLSPLLTGAATDRVGLIILAFFLLMTIIAFLAFIFNLKQTLNSAVVEIMSNTPEQSVNRVFALVLFWAFLILAILIPLFFLR